MVDIGFGDPVYPSPQEADFPGLLDFPAPRLLCYSRESTIAEKFEAMVEFGRLNSRTKDFYDIWLLSRRFDFNGVALAEAIRLTLEATSDFNQFMYPLYELQQLAFVASPLNKV